MKVNYLGCPYLLWEKLRNYLKILIMQNTQKWLYSSMGTPPKTIFSSRRDLPCSGLLSQLHEIKLMMTR